MSQPTQSHPPRQSERRGRRSDDRSLAINYQLDSVRTRGAIDAVVVTDRLGLPIAASGEPDLCEELAALAPLLSRANPSLPLPPLLRRPDIAVRAFEVHGQPLYLASAGGSVTRDVHLVRSVSGVRRILSSN